MPPEAGRPFVLLRGCPRSGTYLLSRLLQEQYLVAIPIETQFIELFWKRRILFGDLSDPKNRFNLTSSILDYIDLVVFKGSHYKNPQLQASISLLVVRKDIPEIVENSANYADIVHGLFAAFARQVGCQAYADKSVLYRPPSGDTIMGALGDVRIVNLVRDGRDVALSWQRVWFGPASVERAAHLWVAHVEAMDSLSRKFPGKLMTVRYEDLVADEQAGLECIGKFASFRRRTEAESAHTRKFAEIIGKDRYHPQLTGEINAKNAGKWKEQMSKESRARFEKIAGHWLRKYGYEVSGEVYGKERPDWLGELGEWARPVHYLRMARSALPLALMLRHRMGLGGRK